MTLWDCLGMAFKASSIVVYIWDMLTAAPLHSANVYMCGIHFHWGPAVISLGKFKRLNAHCRSFLWVYLKRFCVSCPTYFEPLSSQRQVGNRVQSANAKIWENRRVCRQEWSQLCDLNQWICNAYHNIVTLLFHHPEIYGKERESTCQQAAHHPVRNGQMKHETQREKFQYDTKNVRIWGWPFWQCYKKYPKILKMWGPSVTSTP